MGPTNHDVTKKAANAESTPVKSKIKKSWNEAKLKASSPSNRKAHKVDYMICQDQGVALSFVTHPTKKNSEGFVGKACSMIRKDCDLRFHLNIHHLGRRSIDREHRNDSMPSDPAHPEGFKWTIMVRYAKCGKKCTAGNARAWVETDLVPFFNQVARDNNYNCIYEVGDNFSTKPLSCLGDVLVWDDVIQMISEMHEKNSLDQISDDKEIMESYFGERSSEAANVMKKFSLKNHVFANSDDGKTPESNNAEDTNDLTKSVIQSREQLNVSCEIRRCGWS